ncbi:MAG: hypothetical protein QW087_04845 [Methanomassiliicoccales archaeon]
MRSHRAFRLRREFCQLTGSKRGKHEKEVERNHEQKASIYAPHVVLVAIFYARCKPCPSEDIGVYCNLDSILRRF